MEHSQDPYSLAAPYLRSVHAFSKTGFYAPDRCTQENLVSVGFDEQDAFTLQVGYWKLAQSNVFANYSDPTEIHCPWTNEDADVVLAYAYQSGWHYSHLATRILVVSRLKPTDEAVIKLSQLLHARWNTLKGQQNIPLTAISSFTVQRLEKPQATPGVSEIMKKAQHLILWTMEPNYAAVIRTDSKRP